MMVWCGVIYSCYKMKLNPRIVLFRGIAWYSLETLVSTPRYTIVETDPLQRNLIHSGRCWLGTEGQSNFPKWNNILFPYPITRKCIERKLKLVIPSITLVSSFKNSDAESLNKRLYMKRYNLQTDRPSEWSI